MEDALRWAMGNPWLIGIGVLALVLWLRRRNAGVPAAPGCAPVINTPASFGGSLVTGLSWLGIVIIAGTVVIAIFQPTFPSSVSSTKADRQVEKTRANLLEAFILEPSEDASAWQSEAARAAAGAVASEYQLAMVKNKTAATAAMAEAACYLPKGHPDRALWDAAGLDPCEASVPAGIQASTRAVAKTTGEVAKNAGDAAGKIDIAALDKELSNPLMVAQTNAGNSVSVSKGLVAIPLLLIFVVILASVVGRRRNA